MDLLKYTEVQKGGKDMIPWWDILYYAIVLSVLVISHYWIYKNPFYPLKKIFDTILLLFKHKK